MNKTNFKTNFDIKDKKTIKLINTSLYISFFICLIGTITLYIYNKFYISMDVYKASIIIFRTGLLSAIFSIICGIFFNKYKNELN